MKCRNCGHKLHKVDEFCTKCGQKVIRKTKKRLVYIAGIFILILFLLGGWIVANRIYIANHMESASQYVDDEAYVEAIEIYSMLLDRDEENVEAKKELIDTYNLYAKQFLDEKKFTEALFIANIGYKATENSDLIEIAEMIELGKIYDQDENLTYEISYNDLKQIKYYVEYIYSKNDSLDKKVYYTADHEELNTIAFVYNAQEVLSNRLYYDAEDHLYAEEVMGDNGILSEKIAYDDLGQVVYKEAYEKNGLDREITQYYADGTSKLLLYNRLGALKEATFMNLDETYVYSEYKDDLLIQKSYMNKENELEYYLIFDYEFKDGLIKRTYNDVDELQYIYEYDRNGNLWFKYEYVDEELYVASEYDESKRPIIKLWFDYYGDVAEYVLIDYKDELTSEYALHSENEGVTFKVNQYFTVYYDVEYMTAYEVRSYDAFGNELQMVSFYSDATLKWYYKNEYDENGHIVKRHDYDDLGQQDGFVEYVCDSDGNPLKEYHYNVDADMYAYVENTYTEDGLLVSNAWYSGDRILIRYEHYDFDEEGDDINYYYE